jgi:predicted aldo/keto reductase-like oxidoreductase
MGSIPRVEKMLRERMDESTKCVECGTCETRCPYQLPIRELLKTKREYIAATLNR